MFPKICGGLENGQICECFQENPDRKRENHGAARVAQISRGAFAVCSSVSPRWLQGLPCHPFPKKLLVGTKINQENK